MRAHEGFSGGSPGSMPRPVYPDQVPAGWTGRFYQPINGRLDLASAADRVEPVRVAVLDTRPDLKLFAARASKLQNEQLLDTVAWVRKHSGGDRPFRREVRELVHHHTDADDGQPSYRMVDHGLFVAGLIHGIAPRAPISLDPALDEMGRGDLS